DHIERLQDGLFGVPHPGASLGLGLRRWISAVEAVAGNHTQQNAELDVTQEKRKCRWECGKSRAWPKRCACPTGIRGMSTFKRMKSRTRSSTIIAVQAESLPRRSVATRAARVPDLSSQSAVRKARPTPLRAQAASSSRRIGAFCSRPM